LLHFLSGTLDGANIEIRDAIGMATWSNFSETITLRLGHENVFIFGAKAEEVEELRSKYRYLYSITFYP